MDSSELTDILDRGESLTIEFKADRHLALTDDDLAEVVVCLANGEGGLILVGVEDNGKVTGLGAKRAREDSAQITAMLFNKTEPPQSCRVDRVATSDGDVIVVSVAKATRGIVATSGGKCVHRVMGTKGPECKPFPPSQHVSRLTDLNLLDYSAHIVQGTTIADVDPVAMGRLRSLLRASDAALAEQGDGELLQSLQLAAWSADGPPPLYVAGLLLVGSEEAIRRYLPTHQVAFQVIDADSRVVRNEFLGGPLLVVLDQMETRFDALNNEAEVEIGMVRIGIPDYPRSSFREGLLNALVHRDYSRLGPIHVQMLSDHLLIANPGGFPAGVTLENLLVHEPVARNPRLAETLLRLGLVERAGRGIDRIYLNQLRSGRPAPDYSESTSDAVRLRLPGGAPSLQFVKFVVEEERKSQFTLGEMLVLNALHEQRRITSADAQRMLQVSPAVASGVLRRLTERGLVRRAAARGAYALTASVYRGLNAAAEYVRGKDYEKIQQVAMVEEYVSAHGRIVRSQVAELCRISSGEAKRLLVAMCKAERLEVVGARRQAYYRAGSAFGLGAKKIGLEPKH